MNATVKQPAKRSTRTGQTVKLNAQNLALHRRITARLGLNPQAASQFAEFAVNEAFAAIYRDDTLIIEEFTAFLNRKAA